MQYEYINLTPHALLIQRVDGSIFTIPPSRQVARVSEVHVPIEIVDGIAIKKCEVGSITGLPPRRENTRYIVPKLVAMAAERDDVFSPGEFNRDSEGRIVSAEGLLSYV